MPDNERKKDNNVKYEYKYDKRTGKMKKRVKRIKTEEELAREEEIRQQTKKRLLKVLRRFAVCISVIVIIIAAYVIVSYILYGEKTVTHKFAPGYEYIDAKDVTHFYAYASTSDYFYGEQYVSAETLSNLSDFLLIGDGKNFNLFFDDDNTAKFVEGSTVAEINGLPKILTLPPVIADEKHFVSFEFIKSSLLGYEFTKSSNNVTYRVQKNELYSSLQLANISNKTSPKPVIKT